MKHKNKTPQKRILANYQIKAKEVRLINAEGKQVGIFPTEEAIQMAKNQGLDLIQITEKTIPPVCKMEEFGKFLYHLKKKQQKAKPKGGEVKEIRLSFKISDHDLETKVNQVKKLLKKEKKVKIEMRLKGREKLLQNFAEEKIKKFLTIINESIPIKIERELKKRPQGLTIIITKK